MLDLVENPEDRFSQNEAHFMNAALQLYMTILVQHVKIGHINLARWIMYLTAADVKMVVVCPMVGEGNVGVLS